MQLKFLGATETVTGSKYLLSFDSKNILVDCGLFQGYKALRLRNWDALPIDAKKIDAVILTHAHIDHTGYIPLLVKNGFEGKIYATKGTIDLASILLPDSGHLQEEEAMFANKWGYSKHKPALPLYTVLDAQKSLKQFEALEFGESLTLDNNISFSFHRAGHILGAAFVVIKYGDKKLVFTGDMGHRRDPLLFDPEVIEEADYLVLESTYGDRLHDTKDVQEQLGEIIRKTVARSGSVIIPSFAVGRAQNLLYYIGQLKEANKIPNVPVFLDSPMAVSASHILIKNKSEHRLSKEECKKFSHIAIYVNTPDDSKAIDALKKPAIIISASGMATGGRILFHLKTYGPDPRNTILFSGYQAGGTRGDRIVRGEKEVKIHGEMIPIRAEVQILHNASAHADYNDILEWLSHFKKPPKKIFITHGELTSAMSLKSKIESKPGWTCIVPTYLQTENL